MLALIKKHDNDYRVRIIYTKCNYVNMSKNVFHTTHPNHPFYPFYHATHPKPLP